MKSKRREKLTYLDNAATTFPKPPEVSASVKDCMDSWCGNPGRGSHPLAMRSAEEIYKCRRCAAEMFGCDNPENVIFTSSTTHAINIATKGLLKEGDHALCSDMEHNSVYRPLYRLQKDGVITFDIFNSFPRAPFRSAERVISSIESLINPRTRMVVCTHASNVCPVTLPIREIGRFCREKGLYFVVDAAQSAGILPIDVKEMCIDALCLPAHKGLYGPQGCGMLILGDGISPSTLFEGGNGVDSLSEEMSDIIPERYEAGTLPTPAISGLLRGMEFVRSVGIDSIRAHEEGLCSLAKSELERLDGIQIFTPDKTGSLLLFAHERIPSEVISAELGKKNICVRAGFHCAALAHRALHTPSDGAVRASFGYFNSEDDIARLTDALKNIIANV